MRAHSLRSVFFLLPCTVLFLCLLFSPSSLAAEGVEITESCVFTQSGKTLKEAPKMLDRDYRTYAFIYTGKALEVDGQGQKLGSVFFQFNDHGVASTLQAQVHGEWQTVATCGTYLTEWYALPEGTTAFRLNNDSRSRMYINEIYVYGPGSQPRYAASWHTGESCDLMLISCHPDDEVLWFGGLLPTYAGEYGYEVQVVVVVPSTPERRLELLDSLWHCGVTRYPHFLGLKDARSSSLQAQYNVWSKDSLCYSIVKAIRTYHPVVVVSHDLYGEYGHGGHMATGDATRLSVGYAANPKKYGKLTDTYGVWQVQKLYLHLYTENRIEMDWHVPLSAFGGKDGFTVAAEAFQYHKSQLGAWAIEDGGKLSNAVFGLVASEVGEDVIGHDFFENTGLTPPVTEHRPLVTEDPATAFLVNDDDDGGGDDVDPSAQTTPAPQPTSVPDRGDHGVIYIRTIPQEGR